MTIRLIASALACVLFASALLNAQSARSPSATGLTVDERRIVAAVDQSIPDATTLLQRVVDIPSATQNVSGVKAVGQVFKSQFDSLRFDTKWSDMPPEVNRAGHLIAEHRGTQGKRLLILGHLDTVLESERFSANGSVASGSGVADMKGGDVVLLFALKALTDLHLLDNRQVIVVLTGDEENAGSPATISRHDVTDAARRSDIALSFEMSSGDDALAARRGGSSWTLEVTGSSGHSMGMFGPDRGAGAIFEAARILNAFYTELRGERFLTFNPSVIVGGTDVDFSDVHGTATGKTNVVPQKVVVRGDLRYISEQQLMDARQTMRAIVDRHLPATSATIAFEDGLPAMPPSEASNSLLRMLTEISVSLGAKPIVSLDPGDRGAGDISYAAPYISGLDGLGIKGAGTHALGETADLRSLPLQVKRAALMIYRLTR